MILLRNGFFFLLAFFSFHKKTALKRAQMYGKTQGNGSDSPFSSSQPHPGAAAATGGGQFHFNSILTTISQPLSVVGCDWPVQ